MIETAFLYGVATLFLFGIADALASIPAKRMSPVAITVVIDSFILIFFSFFAVLLWDTYIWNLYTLLAIVGNIVGYFGFLLFVYSLQEGKVGVSTAIANGYPVLATLFGVVVLREFLPLPAVVAILLVVIGIFGLSTKFSFVMLFDKGVTNKSRLFALGAMCMWAAQVIIADRAVTELSPFQVTHIGTITTLVLGLAIFSLSKETFGSLYSIENQISLSQPFWESCISRVCLRSTAHSRLVSWESMLQSPVLLRLSLRSLHIFS